MELKSLLEFEEGLVLKGLVEEFEDSFHIPFANGYEKIRSEQNDALVSLVDSIAERIHAGIIIGLGIQYLKGKTNNLKNTSLRSAFVSADGVEPIKVNVMLEDTIPDLCEAFHVQYLNSHISPAKNGVSRSRSKVNIIERGAVYTLKEIVDDIVGTAVSNYSKENEITVDLQVLDFACGTGRFYVSAIEHIAKYLNANPSEVVLRNVCAIDLDPNAVNVTRLKGFSYLSTVSQNDIDAISAKIIWRNGLMSAGLMNDESLSLMSDDFCGRIHSGFDIIVSNPPYLVLKNSKKGGTEESARRFKNQVDYFKKSGDYVYSIEGMLNLYQLSIERMLTMLKPHGELGVICPSSLFADISATKLRKHMLEHNNVRSIRYYAEDDLIFENVLQATVIFQLQKSGATTVIAVNDGHNSFKIDLKLVRQLFPDKMEIPFITKPEWDVLKHLSKFKKLKDIPTIRNKRGELDVTLCRRYITMTKTPYRLVRGNMISADGVKDINHKYVDESFLKQKSEDFMSNDFGKQRLVCQQISNAGQARRLKFVFCEKNDILGNSCNYLSSDAETLKKLNIIMNSSLLNWRFKITSSNNHINNYELAELPLPDLDKMDANAIFANASELDAYVNALYGVKMDFNND